MKRLFSLFLVLASLPGCLAINTQSPSDGGEGCPGSDAGPPPDLATPAPKCAAAQGLAGDNLLCVDFKNVQNTPNLPSLDKWSFSCTGGATWGTANGLLQVNDFGTFKDECTAKLPAVNLSDADKQKYKSLTLAVVQRIDLNDPEQNAEIFLNSSAALRRMWQGTGKKDVPKQRTIIEIDKAELPAMVNNAPQWILKLSSTGLFGRQGWQIESIAIQGVQ